MNPFNKLYTIIKYINNHPLAGKHRFTAYRNFLYWQITQLIHEDIKTINFIENTKLIVKKGMTGATGNIYLGLHDYYEMSFLLHFLQKDDLFADIGSNIGSYSILASGVNNASTIAFEPSLKAFNHLQKNISLNKLENKVKAINIALGGKIEKLYFTADLDTANHVLSTDELQNFGNYSEVNVNTLDNILKGGTTPILIKIDVEGFETEVLKGMNETLGNDNLKAILIELNGSGLRYSYDERKIHNLLLEHKFNPYFYDPLKREFKLLKDFGSHNTLYLRDIDFILERVKKAKKINVFKESF